MAPTHTRKSASSPAEKLTVYDVMLARDATAPTGGSRTTLEAAVRESVIEDFWCSETVRHGGITYKFTSPGIRGVSDQLAAIWSGLHLVELKRPKGGVYSIHQIKFREAMQRQGIVVHQLHTIEAIAEWFRTQNPWA